LKWWIAGKTEDVLSRVQPHSRCCKGYFPDLKITVKGDVEERTWVTQVTV
jgi:hypothetical protein